MNSPQKYCDEYQKNKRIIKSTTKQIKLKPSNTNGFRNLVRVVIMVENKKTKNSKSDGIEPPLK